jgi:hypothetical protein
VGRRGSHTFLDNRLAEAVALSALRANRTLTPGRLPLVISVRSRVDPKNRNAASRIGSIEKSNGLTKIRSRHLRAGSVVPQPTTLPRTPTSVSAFQELQRFSIENQSVMLLIEISFVYYKNHSKHITIGCKNACEILNLEALVSVYWWFAIIGPCIHSDFTQRVAVRDTERRSWYIMSLA